jgi:CubicO group peptidase (beta-lactamase class C family)
MLSAAFAACCASTLLGAETPPVDDSLVGLWYAEHLESVPLQGEVMIYPHGSDYQAHGEGFEAPVSRNRDRLWFVVSGRGEFRGRLGADMKTITGHWIQPAGLVSFQPRATALDLVPSRGGSWTGQIVPLDEHLHVYVDIRRDGNGLVAVIRIPENNWWGATLLKVDVHESDVTLGTPFPPPRNQLRGQYDAGRHQLRLPIVNATPDVFAKIDRQQALGFYARTPQPSSYSYRPPVRTRDGWRTGDAQATGLSLRPIRDLMQSILDADPADIGTMPVHSLLIARHGKLVVEEYFYGFDRDRPHDSRSAGKTYAPLLVGVARNRGANLEPETRLADAFPKYRPFANADDRKAQLTLEHLMTMTSGLACDDNDPASPGQEDRMQTQQDQRDWYKYTLDLPMASDPGGTSAVYCSADLNLIGGAAGTGARLWNVELFAEAVAKPLQFGRYYFNLSPTGDGYTGGGLYLRPRDALKLGQLYLDGGRWNGRRVIDSAWVNRSTTPHATFRPVNDLDLNHEYGYGWHVHHFNVAGRTFREYAAEGNGGQLVMVFPELDMVVGVNAGKYSSPLWYRWTLEMIPKYLISAVVTSQAGQTTRQRSTGR